MPNALQTGLEAVADEVKQAVVEPLKDEAGKVIETAQTAANPLPAQPSADQIAEDQQRKAKEAEQIAILRGNFNAGQTLNAQVMQVDAAKKQAAAVKIEGEKNEKKIKQFQARKKAADDQSLGSKLPDQIGSGEKQKKLGG